MPFSLNDVHVVPLTSKGSLIRIQSPSPTPEDDDEEVSVNHKGVSVHVNKHHDDGVPFAVVPVVAIFFTFAYLIVKAIMAPFTNRARQAQASPSGGLSEEEIAILHKLERTLSQMESRVEALETILIDQTRTAKNYGSKF